MSMKKEKNKKVYASSRTALAVLAVASLIAFCLSAFVSTDVVTNTFKASTLDIALIEENYDKLTEKQRFSLIPNRRLDKDPKIKNTDNTDAFVFLKVTVPVAEVTEKDIRSQTSSDYSFTQLYSYTGNVQSFTVSQTGYYKLEAWGAQGGSASHSISDDKTDVSSQIDGGKGGYSCGTVYLEKDQTIYIYVGGQGESITASTKSSGYIVNGGYNGGGNALVVSDSQYYYLGSGGGATHFAFSSGTLSNLSENKNSVLLVAGGGGGSYYRYFQSLKDYYYYGYGGYGGGENGGSGDIHASNSGTDFSSYITPGGGQTDQTGINTDYIRYGTFGQGVSSFFTYYEDNSAVVNNDIQFYDSGAGGGWYGGGKYNGGLVGGGGSGYCNTEKLTAYSNIAGNELFPDTGNGYETGHEGNGCARITYLNTRNQEVFYLKTAGTSEYLTSNTFNTSATGDNGYWIELPDCESGTNLTGKTKTYVFGYSVYLEPEEVSETLFDYIQLKNILQYELSPDTYITVNVQAYGIQADYLDDIEKDSAGEKAVMTVSQLTEIYGYISDTE